MLPGGCASCSSILRASRLATPDAADTQPGAAYVDRSQPKEWVMAPDGQRFALPLLGRPTSPTSMGSQWVFVIKESQANGQVNGYWIIVPVGREIDP